MRKVEIFSRQDFMNEIADDITDEDLKSWENKPVIIAEQVRKDL